MRFNPPPVTLPVELTWLLGAAFGPVLPPMSSDPGALPGLARRFDLGPRIVARHGAGRIEDRLGPAAGEMVLAHRRSVAFGLAGERTARRVARQAEHRRLQGVFLKGYALQHVAPGPAGWRPFADLDVLLSREHAAELRDLLVADGWAAAEEPGNPQHLPPVQDPEGTPVDIHFRLRGVRVAAERWASAEELLAADLCLPTGLAEGAWVPRPQLLAAHVVVHALEQHGHRPGTYPLMRAVADIIDLVTVADEATTALEVGRLVGETLDEADLRALFALGRILAKGRIPTAEADAEGDAEALLHHIVAGALDPDYRQGLAIDHTTGRLRQALQDGELMRYIARKLKAPADPSDVDTGGTAGDLGPVRRRILRPIRLAARFTAAAAARLRRAFNR